MVALNSTSALFSITEPAPEESAAQAAARYDTLLVQRFKAGDAAAFTEIVLRHRGRMFAVALARLGNCADAEEIAQDTFVRAHRALASFRGESSLSTWLHRITVNLSLNRYWHLFRRRRHLTRSLDHPLQEGSRAIFADLIASDTPSPVSEAITHELTQLVARCMEQLAAPHREILSLRILQHRSYEEISDLLGINVGTVKSRIARARQNLRILMQDAAPDSVDTGEPLDAWESLRVNCRLGLVG